MTRGLTLAVGGALAAATVWLYASHLGDAPVYLAHDEIKFALQAHAIASTGRDINGIRLPLFFSEPGFAAGRDPVSIYLTALLLKGFPFAEWSVRLPSALVGAVDVVLMFALALRIFNRVDLALFAAALLALTPAHYMYARFAVDVVYPLPFLMAWLLCLHAHVTGGTLRSLFAAMLFLGMGVYSYLAFLVMTPVYLVLTAFTLRGARSVRPYVVAAIGFALALVPLAVSQVRNPGRYTDLVGAYRVYDAHLTPLQGLKDLLSYFSFGVRTDVYWKFFNPSFLFFSGDSSVQNSTRLVGVFLTAVLFVLPLGIYHILRTRNTRFNLLLLWGFASAPLAAVVVADVAIRRALVMLPFAVLIATFGMEALLLAPARRWRVAAACVVVACVWQFSRFHADYLGDYRLRSGVWFGGNIRQAVVQIIERDRQRPVPWVFLSNGIPYIDAYWDFYLIKHDRTELSRRTTYYDPTAKDLQVNPPLALVLCPIAETPPVTPSDPLTRLSVIAEPNGTPSFSLFER